MFEPPAVAKLSLAFVSAVLIVAGVSAYSEYDYDHYSVSTPSQSIDEETHDEHYDYDFPHVQARRIDYQPGTTSRFWGFQGELFDPSGRMTDWSTAGYRMGEVAIPNPTAQYDLVRDFGAVPDDGLSDWNAFFQAFRSVPAGGVLSIPPGTFVLDKPVSRNSSIILRGAGRDLTKIYLPNSLDNLYGPWKAKATPSNNLSPWRDDPYFLSFNGQQTVGSSTLLGQVAADAWRGDSIVRVQLASGVRITAGTIVRIVGSDNNYSLVRYLYGNLTEQDWKKPVTAILNNGPLFWFQSRVRVVTSLGGSLVELELERPLAYDMKPQLWKNLQVHRFATTGILTETGVEDLTFEFAPSVYAGHLTESGYNAMTVSGCVHCWFRRLRFVNVDTGLHIATSYFTTTEDIIFSFNTDRTGGRTGRFEGHHALRFARSTDNIMRHISLQGVFMHDLTVDHMASLNVFHNITGKDVSMDFHSKAPCMNLLSRINCGKCSRTWASGGAANTGGHAGLFNFVWGLSGSTPTNGIAPMWAGFAANFTMVGAALSSIPSYNGFLLEALDPALLTPWDLQGAQLSRRMATRYGSGTAASPADPPPPPSPRPPVPPPSPPPRPPPSPPPRPPRPSPPPPRHPSMTWAPPPPTSSPRQPPPKRQSAQAKSSPPPRRPPPRRPPSRSTSNGRRPPSPRRTCRRQMLHHTPGYQLQQ